MRVSLNQGAPSTEIWGIAALDQRRRRTQDHLAKIAPRRESWIKHNRYYYELLGRLLRFVVEPQKKVLSVRCGTGNLLAAVKPSDGKGIDICAAIVEIAQQRNSSFNFAVAFPDKDEFLQTFTPGEKFDYILFNDIGDTVDVLQAFKNLRPLCERHTRVLVTTYNHSWEPLVTLAEWIGMKVPRTEQNWLSTADIRNLLKLAGFEALERINRSLPGIATAVWFLIASARVCHFEQALHDAGGRCRIVPRRPLRWRPCRIGRHSTKNEWETREAVRRMPRRRAVGSFSATTNRPMAPPRKCSECNRAIRKRIFVLSMGRAFVSHETYGQASMQPKVIYC